MKQLVYIIFAAVVFFSPGPGTAGKAAQKNVLFLGLSSGDKNTIEDVKKINDLLFNDINKTLKNSINVLNLSEPYAYSTQREVDSIATSNRSGWVIYGTVRFFKNDQVRIRLYLYDTNLKKDVLDRFFDTSFIMNSVTKENLELFYAYIAEENGYFTGNVTGPDPYSRIALIDFNISHDTATEFRKLKPYLKQYISGAMGNRLTVLNDEKFPFINMKSSNYRSEKRMAVMSDATRCNWIISGQVFRGEQGPDHEIIISLYNRHSGDYQSVIQVSAPDFSTASSLAAKRMENFFLTMSISTGYSLHRPDDMKYITEFSYMGPSSVDAGNISPYSVHYTGKDLVTGCYGIISRFDDSGRMKGNLGSPGTEKGEFQLPMQMDSDGRDNVYVFDTGVKKVLVYDRKGLFLREFFHNASAAQDFCVSSNGNVFIPDPQKSLILVYNTDGLHINTIRIDRENPLNITSFRGNPVVITEKDNYYIITYLSDSGHVIKKRHTGINRSLLYMYRCAMDDGENLYGIDVSKNIIFKIDSNDRVQWIISELTGSERKYLNTPQDITVSATGDGIYVADVQNRRVVHLSSIKKARTARTAAGYTGLASGSPKGSKAYLYYIDMALSLDQQYAPALLARAEYYDAIGQYTSAIPIYERLLAKNRKNNRAIQGLDKSRMAMYTAYARFHEDNFRAALDTGPESARPHYEKSVRYYEQALKLAPSDNRLRERYNSMVALFQKSQGVEEIKNPDIESVTLQEIFSSLYKFYTDNEIGSISIKNTTGHTVEKIYAEIKIQDIMDYPTDTRSYRQIAPDEQVRLGLYAVFNNRITAITENTPVSAQITVHYTIRGKEYSITRNESLTIYNRNAMTWDTTEKLSAFITVRDTAVKIFARTTAQQFRNHRLEFMNPALQSSMEVFDSLCVFGITYVKDPRTPFVSFSKRKDLVDHIQYPRETLRFKTGDCDDLTVLYCALLENLGIETALVTVPGHIYMMFNTEVPSSRKGDISADDRRFIIYRDSVWIPVETTATDASFVTAWEKGMAQYSQYSRDGRLEIIPVKDAWKGYAPVTLQDDGWEPKVPGADETGRIYHKDINTIIDNELTRRVNVLERALQQDSGNCRIYNSIGVTYARFGKYEKATSWFEKALEIDPSYFSANNNMGNIRLLQGRYDESLVFFEKARTIQPENPAVHVNMALIYRKLNQPEKMKEMMNIALRYDSSLQKRYGFILEQGTLKADQVTEDSPVWLDE